MRLAVRLAPRAKAERIDGVADGRLRVAVTAPPVDNAANEALLRFLAQQCRLPRRDFSIVAGAKSRNKLVRVAGDPNALILQIKTAIGDRPGD